MRALGTPRRRVLHIVALLYNFAKKTMKPETNNTIRMLAWQIGLCMALALLTPTVTLIFNRDVKTAQILFGLLFSALLPMYVVYFVNYYVLVPFLCFKGRRRLYILCNVALILLVNGPYVPGACFSWNADLPEGAHLGIIMGAFLFCLGEGVAGFIALAQRTAQRDRRLARELADEKQRHTEAELHWLKNQLNPHFLFNTLNNISSLAQIDPDLTQDSIARLSELLRYAMYESDKATVPLGKEVEFMRNYIALMQLRCNDRTVVETDFNIADENAPIAPLLLVSFIENAFKHGVSSSRPSYIRMSIREADGQLTFVCENSNFPKDYSDHSGSGIGLSNTRRRFDLLYPGRYTWEQVSGLNYSQKITMQL